MGVHSGGICCSVLWTYPSVKLGSRQVDTAKPKDKPYKHCDDGGLYFWLTLIENTIGDLNIVLPVRRSCLLLELIPTWLWLKFVVNVKKIKGALLVGLVRM